MYRFCTSDGLWLQKDNSSLPWRNLSECDESKQGERVSQPGMLWPSQWVTGLLLPIPWGWEAGQPDGRTVELSLSPTSGTPCFLDNALSSCQSHSKSKLFNIVHSLEFWDPQWGLSHGKGHGHHVPFVSAELCRGAAAVPLYCLHGGLRTLLLWVGGRLSHPPRLQVSTLSFNALLCPPHGKGIPKRSQHCSGFFP